MKTILCIGVLLCAAAAHAEGAPKDPRLDDARGALARLDQRLGDEPPVADVQRWAIGAAALQPEHTRRLLLDGARAGGLPWVRLRGRFQDQDRKEFDEVALLSERNRQATWALELWVEWDLGDAVAGPERFKAAREARSQVELRQALAHEVTVAYFDRRRLLTEQSLDPPVDTELASLARDAERRLRVQELDGLLDALTGGRWARALRSLQDLDLPGADPVTPEGGEEVAEW